MPNWCSNSFTVTGNQKEIDDLTTLVIRENIEKDYEKGGDLFIDFNGLSPMPEEFDHLDYYALNALMIVLAKADNVCLMSSALSPKRKAIELIADKLNANPILADWPNMTVQQFLDFLNTHPETAEQYAFNIEVFRQARYCWQSHGSLSAYEWKLAHWGVGRNAMWSMVSFAPNTLTVTFETAWGPPEMFYRSLVEKFPNLDFQAIYLEESNGVAGVYRNQNGVWVDEPVHDVHDNIRRFAIEVFGYEYEEDGE